MPIAPKEAETVRDALRALCVGVKEFTWQTYEEAGIASGECGVLGHHAESGFELRIEVDDEGKVHVDVSKSREGDGITDLFMPMCQAFARTGVPTLAGRRPKGVRATSQPASTLRRVEHRRAPQVQSRCIPVTARPATPSACLALCATSLPLAGSRTRIAPPKRSFAA